MAAWQAMRRVGCGGEQGAGVQLADGDVALQRVEVDGDVELGGLPAGGRQFAGA